jgi:tetratricopeptide (TPR) repeat protein
MTRSLFMTLAASTVFWALGTLPSVANSAIEKCLKLNPYREIEATYNTCQALLTTGGQTPLDEAKLHAQIGEAYYWAQRYDLAIEAFDKALQLDKMLFETRIQRGWAFYRTNEASRAYQDFSDALEQNPKSGRAVFGLGFLYGAYGDVEKQRVAYEQAIELSPKYYLARGGLAHIEFYFRDDPITALQHLDRLISFGETEINSVQFLATGTVFPTQDYYADTIFERSYIRMRVEQFNGALEDVDWVMHKYPENFAPLARKAEILLTQSKPEEAIKYAEDAHHMCIDKTPFGRCDFSAAVLSETYFKLKKFKESADVGRELFESQRGGEYTPAAIYYSGLSMKNSGDVDGARKFMLMLLTGDRHFRGSIIARLQGPGFYEGSRDDDVNERMLNGLEACLLDDQCMGG